MKIVSVGCSFTEGSGVGRINAYTRHLADLMNCDYKNFAESGHSNGYIFRKIIQLINDWNNDDILIIQWTSPNRQTLVTNEGYSFYPPFITFMSLEFLFGQDVANHPDAKEYTDEKQKDIIKNHSNFLNEYEKKFSNFQYLDLISYGYQISIFNMLENLKIKHIQFYGWDSIKLDVKKFVNKKFLQESFGGYTNTNHNEHPDLNGHLKWAKFLFNKVNEFNYV